MALVGVLRGELACLLRVYSFPPSFVLNQHAIVGFLQVNAKIWLPSLIEEGLALGAFCDTQGG